MNPVSVDIKNILVDKGIGVFGADKGWGINISTEPKEPDQAITIYDSVSAPPGMYLDTRLSMTRLNSALIRVRSSANSAGYLAGWNKAEAIFQVIVNRGVFFVGTVKYGGFVPITDVEFLKKDENSRPLFVMRVQAIREDTVLRT